MKIIGITGGIGSGKSRILQFMEENCHAYVCQADFVARQLQEPGQICYDEIVRCFGNEILLSDRHLNREKLGQMIFHDSQLLQTLNQIVHPQVKRKICTLIDEQKDRGTPLFVIEAALLIEDHYNEICDELWYIHVEAKIRKKRLVMQRGYSEEKMKAIFKNQASEEVFLKTCQRTIENSGTFEDTCRQVKDALQEIM